jgi:predicted dehydrogenase
MQDYLDTADDAVIVALLIETAEAVRDVADILDRAVCPWSRSPRQLLAWPQRRSAGFSASCKASPSSTQASIVIARMSAGKTVRCQKVWIYC